MASDPLVMQWVLDRFVSSKPVTINDLVMEWLEEPPDQHQTDYEANPESLKKRLNRAMADLERLLSEQPDVGMTLTCMTIGKANTWTARVEDQPPRLAPNGRLVSGTAVDALVMAYGALVPARKPEVAGPHDCGPWSQAVEALSTQLLGEVPTAPYLRMAPPPGPDTIDEGRKLVLRVLRRNQSQRQRDRNDQRRILKLDGQPQFPGLITGCAARWRLLSWSPQHGIAQHDLSEVTIERGETLSALVWQPPSDLDQQLARRWDCHCAGDATIAPREVILHASPTVMDLLMTYRLGANQIRGPKGISFVSSATDALIALLLSLGQPLSIMTPTDLSAAYQSACRRLSMKSQ